MRTFKRPLCFVREKETEDSFPQQYRTELGPKEPPSLLESLVNWHIRTNLVPSPMELRGWCLQAAGVPGSPASFSFPGSYLCSSGSRRCCLLKHKSGCHRFSGLKYESDCSRLSPRRQCNLSNSKMPIGIKDLGKAED